MNTKQTKLTDYQIFQIEQALDNHVRRAEGLYIDSMKIEEAFAFVNEVVGDEIYVNVQLHLVEAENEFTDMIDEEPSDKRILESFIKEALKELNLNDLHVVPEPTIYDCSYSIHFKLTNKQVKTA